MRILVSETTALDFIFSEPGTSSSTSVRITAFDIFEDFVRGAGLELYPIGCDPADLMAYMVKNPGLIPSMKALRAGNIGRKRAMIAEMLDSCWKSCIEADQRSNTPFTAEAIIGDPPALVPIHCAESKDADRRLANYISYGIIEFLTWQAWQGLGDVINNSVDVLMDTGIGAQARRLAAAYRFFFRDPPAHTPPPDLEVFLHAGPPTV
ncbi:hypothetical protein BKA81DRAFT_410230 [Phyllosticta paracitricarpa]|uniref:Uncharacterized protein n=1 Tax=Phyllosticta paracitricarpa TaxID=2016321 RepID=A0ABR1MTV3_9PEZI